MNGRIEPGKGAEASAPGRRHIPSFPYHIVWLATNACNARCVHCSSDAAKRLPGELSTDEARTMLDELARVGVLDMAISGGEPLTRPDLMELIEYAIARGIRVGLGSNGSTITPEIARRLAEIGLDRLQVSIDGLEATHDLARRWKGLFRRSERAIQLGIAAGLRVHVCFTAHRLNYRELGPVIDRCVEWGVTRFNMSRFVPTGRGDVDLDLTPWEWREVVDELERRRKRYRGVIDVSTHLAQLILNDPSLACAPGFVGCQAGLGQGCIGPEGDVSPCVMLPLRVGNIREMPFGELWRSSGILGSLRDREQLKGWCSGCEHRELCGGCRGVAYAYTGDHLAADPRCWRFAGPGPIPAGPSVPLEELGIPSVA